MMSEQQENINPSASVSTPMDISSSGSSSGSAKVPTWANSLSSSTTAERNSEGTVRGSAQQFATVATGGSKRASVLGDIFRGSQSNRVTEAEKRLSVLSQDDTWEVSLAEKKPAGKRNKDEQPSFTIYVTTPTDSLTLTRTRRQIADFDQQLRRQFKIGQPSPVPLLGREDGSVSPPRKRRAPIFATLSRTLSPGRKRKGQEDQASMTAVLGEDGVQDTHLPTAKVSYYLSEIAKDASAKGSQVWQHFFAPGPNDLQSHRVERRVRQMRSDPAIRDSTMFIDRKDSLNSDADSIAAMVALSQQFIETSEDPEIPKASDIVKRQVSPEKAPEEKTLPLLPASNQTRVQDVFHGGNVSAPMHEEPVPISNEELDGEAAPLSPAEMSQEEITPADATMTAAALVQGRRVQKRVERKTTLSDFDILRVLGKGCAGKVMLVRHHSSTKLYAMKSIHKHHVLAHRELLHTLTEQSVLKRVAQDCDNPFVVRLWWSFHNTQNLFLVLDFHPGGDLATQLARWGRLGRDRTRFYCAEIAEGLEGLHKAGVIYRDLKPENVLIAVDGHIVLTDFGLSKQFARSRPALGPQRSSMDTSSLSSPSSLDFWQEHRETTTTFCGTAEYLAPEVLLGDAYSYECDAWSYGTMLFEMLTGMTPFWADDHTTMYRRVLHEELHFDEEDRNLDADTKSILRGLLQKNPAFRMSDSRIKNHPYFSMIDWDFVRTKRYIAPFIPAINPDDELDTSNFDEAFLSMPAEVADAEEEVPADAEDNAEEKKEPQSEVDEHGRDVFEGYNFGETAYEASVIESIEEEGAAAIPSEKLVDSAEKHSANVSQASLPNTHLQPESQQPEEDTLSNSDRSSSTRITHMDKDIYTSHSTDPSTTTTSDARRRDPSAEVESVKGDHSMQSSETKTDTIPDILEESHDEDGDWDVVEQEDQTAQNGRRVNGRRGIGKTLFQKGVHDRYVLAVVDAVRPTPKRRSSVRAKTPTMTRSMSSRSSSLDESSGADSPGQSRRKVFKLPRNTSSNHIAPNSSGSRTPIKKMRFKMSRTQLKTPKATSSQISLDSVGTPTSDRTAELSPVQWTPSDASQADKVVSTRALNPILGAMKRAT